MTEHEIRTASAARLSQRLEYLTHETRDGAIHYGTSALRHLRAEREAIVAELDWRRTEATWERWHGVQAEGIA